MSWKSFLLVCLPLSLVIVSCRRPSTEGESHDPHTESEPAAVRHSGPRHVELDPEAIVRAGLETVTVSTSMVPETLVATGVVSHNEARLGHVRPLSQGIVRHVFVQPGDRVRQGQQLVRYDNIEVGDLAGEYQEQQAELRAARVDRDVRHKLWERYQELYEHQTVSQVELELREAEFAQADEAVRKWQSALAQTELRLLRYGVEPARIQQLAGNAGEVLIPEDLTLTLLRAPFDGVILDFDVSAGEVVNPQRVLLAVADLATVWVLADVYEKDLGRVMGADSAQIELPAYPNRTFRGRITYLGDVLDPETRTIKVRSVVRNPDHLLKLGMFALVHISTGVSREYLVVPGAAVQMIDDVPVVFVEVSEGRFETRPVRTGRRADGMIVVEEGLLVGEKVVATGSFSLKSELMREQLGGHGH